MKRIILCADDYGQNSAISQAIIRLLEQNRLSATSCLVTSPLWPQLGKLLEPFKNQADIGLHFNLTDGEPLSADLASFCPLPKLIIKSHLRLLDKKSLAAELNSQLNAFVAVMGQMPAYIDGHQHIHQFPVIREALLMVYEKRLRQYNVYIRSAYTPIKQMRQLKHIIIQMCGGYAFKQLLLKNNIPHNSSFEGIYDFTQAKKYPLTFSRMLENIEDGGLIMCHPGVKSNDVTDTLYASRDLEYHYFNSEKFVADCEQHKIKITRFK